MAQKQRLPRITIGAKNIDTAFEIWALAIESALNITSDPASGLELHRGKGGIFLRVRSREKLMGKTGGGGIGARSGTTCGSATVELYGLDKDAGLIDLGISETAYNYSGTAVAANKYCTLTRINGILLVDGSEC